VSPNRYVCALVRILALAGIALLWTASAPPAAAHPADEILERDFVHVRPDGIEVEMRISAGIIKLYKVWEDADTNGDGTVTEAEREQFGQMLATGYDVTLDGVATPLRYVPGSLGMAATRDAFGRQGASPDGATVTAVFRLPLDAAHMHTTTINVNHYNAYANGSEGVDRPPELYPDAAPGVGVTAQGPTADYDLRLTIAPAATTTIGGNGTGGATAVATTGAPSVATTVTPPRILPPMRSPNTGRVTWLTDLLLAPTRGPGYALLGMVVAVALGALHALTPGHGKTMVAAYLVGGRGRGRDAVVLGGAVTVTHTGSVLLLGVATLLFARFIVPDRIMPWLEAVSGLGILLLGCTLLAHRLRALPRRVRTVARPAIAPALVAIGSTAEVRMGSDAERATGWHSHEDGTEHAHGFGTRAHAHGPATDGVPLSLRSLMLMGMSGGLVPCPDALAILLVAVAAGRVLLGLAVILCFSIGLAAVLIALGVAIASTRVLERGPLRGAGNARWARWIPPASALIVVLIGAIAVGRAIVSIAATR